MPTIYAILTPGYDFFCLLFAYFNRCFPLYIAVLYAVTLL